MENTFSQTPWVSKTYSFTLFSASYELSKTLFPSLEPNGFIVRGVTLLPSNVRLLLLHFSISENLRNHWKEL